jgi:CRP-like cAMP-binding protein
MEAIRNAATKWRRKARSKKGARSVSKAASMLALLALLEKQGDKSKADAKSNKRDESNASDSENLGWEQLIEWVCKFRFPCLEGLAPQCLRQVLEAAQVCHLDSQEAAFAQGDEANELYLIVEGRCTVIVGNPGVAIRDLFPGAAFGDLALNKPDGRSGGVGGESGGGGVGGSVSGVGVGDGVGSGSSRGDGGVEGGGRGGSKRGRGGGGQFPHGKATPLSASSRSLFSLDATSLNAVVREGDDAAEGKGNEEDNAEEGGDAQERADTAVATAAPASASAVDTPRRSATVMAMEPTTLLVIDYASWRLAVAAGAEDESRVTSVIAGEIGSFTFRGAGAASGETNDEGVGGRGGGYGKICTQRSSQKYRCLVTAAVPPGGGDGGAAALAAAVGLSKGSTSRSASASTAMQGLVCQYDGPERGVHRAYFAAFRSGIYTVCVTSTTTQGHARRTTLCCQHEVECVAASTSASASSWVTSWASADSSIHVAGAGLRVAITARDVYGNVQSQGGDKFRIVVEHAASSVVVASAMAQAAGVSYEAAVILPVPGGGVGGGGGGDPLYLLRVLMLQGDDGALRLGGGSSGGEWVDVGRGPAAIRRSDLVLHSRS